MEDYRIPSRSIGMFRISLALLWFATASLFGEVMLIIPNQLNHTWPGELVSFHPKGPKIPSGNLSLEVQGITRPAQRDGDRFWSYVTISDRDSEGNKLDISTVPVILSTKKVAPGITFKKDGDYHLIDNGTYQFRLRNYQGKFAKPISLGDLPHWCGGMKTKEQKDWDGKAYFESNVSVIGAKTELIRSGPVFLDFKITYEFKCEADGEVEAMPLALGKQSHLFKPNQLPREMVPKKPYHYELLIRFVMDDLWVDVNERFHFPRDEKASPYGITQYYIEWGKGGLPVDTASWVRWFEYDKFGGNTDQLYVPAKPRPAQKDRPFALLRPRWNQGGGGAQDFVLTSGGAAPGRKREAGKGYQAENPAVGIVAAYASKWVGPYVNYIPVYALDGNWGRARFPMADGERSEMHLGQRAFGLLAGPRGRMESLNSIVRRHTDWTLTAQINKYILDWKRDPKKAGPNILITSEQLTKLQADYKAGKKTPVNEALKVQSAAWSPLLKERDALQKKYAKEKADLEKQVAEAKKKAKDRNAPKAIKEKVKEPEKAWRTARDAPKKDKRLRELSKKLSGTDFDLYHLLTTGEGREVKMPSSDLWRSRRYQDDFLNPTSSPTRGIPGLATADLFAAGQPRGGANQAAFGYISTDLDAWPGWHQGWRPGNPNFHTDKYMAAMYAGGSLLDHPHSKEWLDFGYQNFKEDASKVFTAPDGVGAECPGYSGYAMKLQLEIARILMNTGFGNVMAENPLVKKNGTWHRKLITPYDRRIERRHEAPHGDTHRWDSGMYAEGFAKLAPFFKKKDPDFASEMMGTWKLLKESKVAASKEPPKVSLKEQVVAIDGTIPATDPAKMDWSSEAFEGFGTIMRDGFRTPGESFLSFKAGPTRGHYHNDENAYHFYSGGTPISLDYNCSYTPRGDHAALHNSMTFGIATDLTHNGSGKRIPAQEEIGSTGQVRHFATTGVADLVIAERSADSLSLRPTYPRDNEFGRGYPSREVPKFTHRRKLVFVKNTDQSPLSDYLVVRDESDSTQKQQLNIHLLAREVSESEDSRTFTATGQLDKDMIVFLAEATEPKAEIKSWYYSDEWMLGPSEYTIRAGESQSAWNSRMEALMKKNKVKSLPLPGWKPTWQDPKSEESQDWQALIKATNGQALISPPHWNSSWMYGEYQKWLRIETKPVTPITWVLYPFKRGEEPPKITTTENGVEVSRKGQADKITFTPEGKITLNRNGKVTSLTD
ncbi:hypothetical protein N9Y81_03810 [Akkermansiaceae bacterium]|nr:hypothetical protein [Akkermansiaceae bacterium]